MTLFHSLFRPLHFSFGPQAGGDASTGAAVTLEVRSPTVDSPAQQGTSSTQTIAAGGTVFSLGSFKATVTDTQIVFDGWAAAQHWFTDTFEGPVAVTAGGWSAFSLDSSSVFPGFGAERMSVNGTTLAFNMRDLDVGPGTKLVVNVSALPA